MIIIFGFTIAYLTKSFVFAVRGKSKAPIISTI